MSWIRKNRKFILIGGYVFFFLIAMIFIFYSFNFDDNISSTRQSYQDFSKGWTYVINGEEKKIGKAPTKVKDDFGDKLTIKNTIPSNIVDCSYLGFFSIHQRVLVSIDGMTIYDFDFPEGITTNTVGNNWNFVLLPEGCEGKSVEITFASCYASVHGEVPEIMIGSRPAMVQSLVYGNLFAIITCIFILGLGILSILVWSLFRKKYSLEPNLLCVGLLCVILSFWSFGETHLLNLLFGYSVALSEFSFISLMLIPFPFLMFFYYNYSLTKKEKSILFSMLGVDILSCFLLIILKITNAIDLKSSVTVTHLLLVAFSAFAIYLLYRIIKNNPSEQKRNALIHIFGLLALALCFPIDLYLYYLGFTIDASLFTRFGMLCYVLAVGFISFQGMEKLIKQGKNVDSLRFAAYHDHLTKLNNRRSFDEKISDMTGSLLYKGIIVLDIDKLKSINDKYGHLQGDSFIVSSGEIVSKSFSAYGNVYRLAGDEFAVVIDNVRIVDFEAAIAKMHELCRATILTGMDEKVSLSCGYATYDPNLDKDFLDTMDRADQNMYSTKKE